MSQVVKHLADSGRPNLNGSDCLRNCRGAAAQSVERATPSEEVPGSIPVVAAG